MKNLLWLLLFSAPMMAQERLAIWVTQEGVQHFHFTVEKGSRSTEAEIDDAMLLLGMELARERWCLDGYTILNQAVGELVVAITGTCKK